MMKKISLNSKTFRYEYYKYLNLNFFSFFFSRKEINVIMWFPLLSTLESKNKAQKLKKMKWVPILILQEFHTNEMHSPCTLSKNLRVWQMISTTIFNLLRGNERKSRKKTTHTHTKRPRKIGRKISILTYESYVKASSNAENY